MVNPRRPLFRLRREASLVDIRDHFLYLVYVAETGIVRTNAAPRSRPGRTSMAQP